MKVALPLGMLLLVGAAVALHRMSLSPTTEEKRAERSQTALVREEPPELRKTAQRPEPAVAAPSAPQKRTDSPTIVPKAAPSFWNKMVVTLDRGLALTVVQQSSVEQLLKDRELEIKACHEAILRTGVIDIRHYEWQVELMKDSWYRKIDALLDRSQHERFVALVQQGFFNEGLAFTIEPGMTVLD